MIRNERNPGLVIFDFYDQGAIAAAAFEFFRTTASVPRAAQARLEALREECENVKDCGLSATVRTQKNSQRCQILEFNSAKRPKILDLQICDFLQVSEASPWTKTPRGWCS